ncbi:hypothetical protein [Paenibacillus kandeliae]|uniref:hypothetical protein n=1 Tax=Paenibacillus kandeliae TaxID=3231269 RepID=UPI003458BEB7
MKKISACVILLSISVMLTACIDSSNKKLAPANEVIQQDNTNENSQSKEVASSEEAGFLTGDKFKENSDFVIKDFTLTHNKQKKTVAYHLEYKLGPDATAFIVDHQQPYYFRLEVPEKWRESFISTQSVEVKGSKLDGNSDSIYSLELEVPLKSGVSDSTIQQIVTDPYDYVLYLYENPNFPARVIGNIYGWMRTS